MVAQQKTRYIIGYGDYIIEELYVIYSSAYYSMTEQLNVFFLGKLFCLAHSFEHSLSSQPLVIQSVFLLLFI